MPETVQPEERPHAEQRDLVSHYHEQLAAARKLSKDRRKTITTNRKVVAGRLKAASIGEALIETNAVRANVIYSTILGLLPHLFAQNPEADARPHESVDVTATPWVKDFAETMARLLNLNYREGRLKDAGIRYVLAGLVTGAPFLKAVYQRDVRTDPHIQSRLNDVQDNIQDIEGTKRRLRDPERQAEREWRLEYLRDQRRQLEQQVEIEVASGMRFDYVPFEAMEIDHSINQLCDYRDAEWLAQRYFIPIDRAEAQFGKSFKGATTYAPEDKSKADLEDVVGSSGDTPSQITNAQESAGGKLIAVWERWNKANNTVYTMVHGWRHDWARQPYTPPVTGHRFYPYFLLELYPLDGDFYPQDLVELLRELQDEYNRTRTQLANHRDLSVPHWLADDRIDRRSVKNFRDATIGDVTLISTNGKPLGDVIQSARAPTLNPAVYDTAPIRSDVEMISGLGDAQRGAVRTAKTATEAEILQQGLASRSGFMQDRVESVFSDISDYCAQLLLGELSPAEVQRQVGIDSVWPQLSKAEAFELVIVDIRAGSAGKPDKQREQRVWMELLSPLLDLIQRIRELEMQGFDATPEREVVKETFQRFDERLDVERLLPAPPNAQPQPMIGDAMAQAAQALPTDGNVIPFPGGAPAPGGNVIPNPELAPGAGAGAPPQPMGAPIAQ